jgi:hypothetical protein
MYNHILYLLFWIINTAVIYAASQLYPEGIVIGTWKYSQIEAAFYSGFWLTFIIWVTWDFAIARNIKLTSTFNSFAYFFIANVVGIWLITRFPNITGIGIPHYTWAIMLGLVTVIVQRFSWELLVKKTRSISMAG